MSWKVKTIKQIKGQVEVLTGLRIGGGDATMEIGGMDNPIIRNPANNEPYIPGSSIKGKMRSLLEWHQPGTLDANGNTHKCMTTESAINCPICRVFGISASKNIKTGPTRLIVRDCPLNEVIRHDIPAGRVITEDKSENNINRITAMAMPRPMERVVPGVTFDLEMIFKVLDTGDGGAADERFFHDVVLAGLRLIELDYLGGCGTRGCGRVRFVNLTDENDQPITLPEVKFMETA